MIRLGDIYYYEGNLYIIRFESNGSKYMGYCVTDGVPISVEKLLGSGERIGNIIDDPGITNKKTFKCKRCNKEYKHVVEQAVCPNCALYEIYYDSPVDMY